MLAFTKKKKRITKPKVNRKNKNQIITKTNLNMEELTNEKKEWQRMILFFFGVFLLLTWQESGDKVEEHKSYKPKIKKTINYNEK